MTLLALRFLTVLLPAVLLDLILGDPRWLPHPVRWMGRTISTLEPFLRRAFPKTPAGERAAGGALVLLMALLFGGVRRGERPAPPAVRRGLPLAGLGGGGVVLLSAPVRPGPASGGHGGVSPLNIRRPGGGPGGGLPNRGPGHLGPGWERGGQGGGGDGGGEHLRRGDLPPDLSVFGRSAPGHGLQGGEHPGLHGGLPHPEVPIFWHGRR